jgi:hypothetical protein
VQHNRAATKPTSDDRSRPVQTAYLRQRLPSTVLPVVRIEEHPRDGVCIGCAAWLHKRSLPIVHNIHPPFWWRFVPRSFHGE